MGVKKRLGAIKGKHIDEARIPELEKRIAELALNGAKDREIANVLGIDEHTVSGPRFHDLLVRKRSEMRMNVRAKQLEKALAGDTTMLIWLGKNLLEQTDRLSNELSGGVTVKVEYEDIGLGPYQAASTIVEESPAPKPAPEFPIPHDRASIRHPSVDVEERARRERYKASREMYQRTFGPFRSN